ncbi:WSC-domain-containing protein [Fistulina hepatica ATCC 64428]|uniref:WSC-domain-containing protein n=1 Tax=Fistulina hepatica ATCC 64428 TaxID=1128425 RepID=A0A0D7AKF0_9AGAR|nr:WSC-domain-containing protein [Fistulina hepatica ATCC 64428]
MPSNVFKAYLLTFFASSLVGALPSPRNIVQDASATDDASEVPSAPIAYIGCVIASSKQYVLTGDLSSPKSMTPRSCSAMCHGSAYFGLEDGENCYCGNTDSDSQTSKLVSADQCNYKCAGDPSFTCGGHAYMSLYTNKPVNDNDNPFNHVYMPSDVDDAIDDDVSSDDDASTDSTYSSSSISTSARSLFTPSSSTAAFAAVASAEPISSSSTGMSSPAASAFTTPSSSRIASLSTSASSSSTTSTSTLT